MKFYTLFLALILALVSSSAYSAVKEMECQTSHKSGQFMQFHDPQLAININRPESTSREIASSTVTFENVRTKWEGDKVEKVGHFENHKYTIHIEDVNHPNDINDYISIRSQEGHEMMYPLSCWSK